MKGRKKDKTEERLIKYEERIRWHSVEVDGDDNDDDDDDDDDEKQKKQKKASNGKNGFS